VGQPEIAPRGRLGHVEIVEREDLLVDQPFAQQPVLGHRKSMGLRQRQHERVGVERLHETYNRLK
jgi:hypothetical protein